MTKTLTVQGDTVPALGFGTWQLQGSTCEEAVQHALDVGYRHIDTARMYGNEAEVGVAIERSPVDRASIFLTTKVPPAELTPEGVRTVIETSLVKLRTSYLDLCLLHWPDAAGTPEPCLDALLQAEQDGLIRHFGVSNYTPRLFQRALDHAPGLFALQVEYHVFLEQQRLLGLCRQHDCMLTAYSPLARGGVFDDGTLREIADAHGVSPSQIALAWLLRQDHVSAIPKSTSRDHIEDNFEAQQVELTEDQVEALNGLRKNDRLIDPDFAPDWEPRAARL